MSFSIKGTTAKNAEIPELVSFETFAKEQNFPVSVFDERKNANNENPLLQMYCAKNMKKKQNELLIKYFKLIEEYKRIVKEKEERDRKLAEVEYYIKVCEKKLSFLKSEEKGKFDNAVFRIKRKYGEKGAQKIIRKAEINAWDIFKTGRNTAWDIAYDAKRMVPTKSVEEIKAIALPQIMRVAINSKDNFEEVLENLNDGKY